MPDSEESTPDPEELSFEEQIENETVTISTTKFLKLKIKQQAEEYGCSLSSLAERMLADAAGIDIEKISDVPPPYSLNEDDKDTTERTTGSSNKNESNKKTNFKNDDTKENAMENEADTGNVSKNDSDQEGETSSEKNDSSPPF